MSEWVELKAADGHELSAYVAKPKGEPLGAVVVIQEIFGVNPSIRSVADEYARHDFVAIAPALFDRFGKSIELGYTGDDLKEAYDLYGKQDHLGIHYSHHAHAFTNEDWTAMMDFADKNLRRLPASKTFDTFLTPDQRKAAVADAAAHAPARPAGPPAGDPGPPQ